MMGVWGGLCIFDYNRYIQNLIPAFQRGEKDPLLRQVIAKLAQSGYRNDGFRGLAQVAGYCNSTMSNCTLGRLFWIQDGVVYPSAEITGKRLPGWGYEDFVRLFEWTVTTQFVTHFTVFGLSTSRLTRHLFPDELKWDRLVIELINYLDTRSVYWAHGTGGYGEGIRGWLDPEETQLLALCLPLVMQASQDQERREELRLKLSAHYQADDSCEQHLNKLIWFGQLIQKAVDQGHGLLWGRDLELFYDNPRLKLLDGVVDKPIELFL